MSRVVVTGGAGRLGRSVVTALAEAGHEVVSIDRGSLEGMPATQLSVDLLDLDAAAAAFAEIRPDAVVHLAAIAVPGALPDPDIYRINTQLVWSVLQAALASGATKMLLASSPTVMGYGSPSGWEPQYLPLDEKHPTAPWNGYGASKVAMEQIVQMAVRQHGHRTRFGAFRPCYVIAPEEWAGAPTQQGHTVAERIANPELSAVALFNYVDARDAGEFVDAWIRKADDVPNGSTFFVGAPDALYDGDTADGIRQYLPAAAGAADQLSGTQSVFSSDNAEQLLGWRAKRLWRDELVREGVTA
ncbi:nucleoside-diphosphate-sugar epimerase [Microbacterium sorbitolivorans]|uniref:NAD(P)-dependent oxidoreductase n=1 Tax=Microbacterium sorbitolivorans TaxID=1867410 RepID=A0A367Y911_9MICO|nr:NAD(P)-dependent oxidoreductase [Microbacterium sorbitolivorans]RCK62100.1 NAD(P)-dependent oxidoreductase [Microbacterium sorbitolivorans]GGF43201.1 nucleoside-diphosphate-sugar epimerase [Microbacterium sorbitolivorans]